MKSFKNFTEINEALKTYTVSYEYEPHQSNHVVVKAKNEDDAWEKTKKVAADVHGHRRRISHNWTQEEKPKKPKKK
jgi:hypothetical protein